MRKRFPFIVLPVLAGGLWLAGPAVAQEWSPFDPFNNPARGQQKPPAAEAPERAAPLHGNSDDVIRPLGDSGASAVERGDLTPVMAADGSGLPHELWQGLDVGTLSRLISEIDIPPRSPALHQLWLRLITSNVAPPEGGVTDQQFLALRLEILYRSGLLQEAAKALANMPAGDPIVAILAARNDIGLGAQDRGCEGLKAGGAPAQLPEARQSRRGADRRLLLGRRRRRARRGPCRRARPRRRRQGQPRLAGARRHVDGRQAAGRARTGDLAARLPADRGGRRHHR